MERSYIKDSLLVERNADGVEKIKFLVIEKSWNSRCLKNMKSFFYDATNKKQIWVTGMGGIFV